MNLIWYTVLIRAIPETLGLTLLSLAITNEKRSINRILMNSIICGIIAFTFRMLPLKFGIHILLIVILEAIVMNIVLNIKLQKAFISILISVVILIISELVTITFIEYVLKLDPQMVYSNATGILIAGLPSVLMLYIIAFIIYSVNKKKGKYKEVSNNVN